MPLDIPRIRALCFDVDGTLRDTDDQFVVRLAGWLLPLALLFPGRDPHPFARRVVMATESPGSYLFGLPDLVGLDRGLASIGDRVYQRGAGEQGHSSAVIPGVKELLDQLHGRYPMSVVSARAERTTMAFLQAHELCGYFEVIVTGLTCEHTKPFSDPILYAANHMGVPAQACLMIGDTTIDIRAARSAGAQSVGVLCGFGEERELRRAGADMILPSTINLADVLRGPA